MRLIFRSLAKSPGFTVTALLTLALGIGVNTAMFSGLNAILFRTPYPDDAQLVRVHRTSPEGRMAPHSPANFLDHREKAPVFERLAALDWTSFNLAEPGQPAERLRGLLVSADFFPLLGLAPSLGRVFTAEEDQPGKDDVIVISHVTWLRRFNADPGVIGRQLRVDGEAATVIGVMPPSFNRPFLWGNVEAWRPLALSDDARQNRGYSYLGEVARLKPGVSLAQAQAALSTLAAQLALAHPKYNAHTSLRIMPLARSGFGENGAQLIWLVASLTVFVLLIACANLANLQFARHAARVREQAIRIALGASRLRLMREVLAESLLLSLAGGALGLLVALWCNDLFGRQLVVDHLPLPLDRYVLGFAFCASIITGLLFGVLPAWFASRTDVNEALKQGARVATPARAQQRLRHALIVLEIALALSLLAGAGIFVRGLSRVTDRDPGWRTTEVLTGYLNLRGKNYARDSQRRRFYERLEEHLAALPGVERVAFGTSLPTWGFSSSSRFVVEGRPVPTPGTEPSAMQAAISPHYFTTLGLPLREGRTFTNDDRHDAPLVVVISESMARRFWPNESPLGKRIGGIGQSHWREIIGVVSDAGAAGKISGSDTRLQMYHPLAQEPGDIALALRSRHAPEALALDVRRAVAALDPDLPVYEIATVNAEIDRVLASGPKIAGYALASFALLGVALAAVGIYGVIAGFVVQRTNEIGVRMALGAQVRDIFRLVLGQGLRLALLGIVLGLAGAAGVARVVHAVFTALPPTDVATTAVVTAFLFAVALLACWLPARHATRVDPIAALRAD